MTGERPPKEATEAPATGGARLQELTQRALQHPMSLAEDNVIAAMRAVHETAEGGKQ